MTDTPISVKAVLGEDFLSRANFSFEDLGRTTAGLTLAPGNTPNIVLRGANSVSYADVPLRTNIYLDGALIEQPRNFFDMQFDIQRYEILRGPQGTLYGKASPSGTINVRTNDPNLDNISGYTAVSVAQYSAFNTQFGVSVPIVEGKLAVRFAGVYDENESTDQQLITTGEDAQARSKSGRMTLLYQPTDDFDARLSTNYLDRTADFWANIDGAGYSFDDDKVNYDLANNTQGRDKLTVLELNKAFGDHLSLASITAYEDQTYTYNFDLDGTPSPQTGVSLVITGGPVWQQDLRLLSEDNDLWDWQVGLFYGRRESLFRTLQNRDLGFTRIVAEANQRISREESAIYTHNTLKLTDQLNVIVGLRYQQQNTSNHEPVITNGNLNPETIDESVQNKSYYATTGTLKVQYFFTPDLVGYASVDSANRAGAANANIANNLPSEFNEAKPEDSNSVELGLKGNFWAQRGRFAAALYNQIYKDFQEDRLGITVVNAFPPIIPVMVVNAEEAEIRGVELSLGLLPVDNWEIQSMVTFTDAKYNDFEDGPCNPGANQTIPADPGYLTCDLSGERMPVTSRWNGNLSTTYSHPLDGGRSWYARGLLQSQSSQVDLLTRQTLGGFSTMDFFAGLHGGSGNTWDISLWLKNAFNRRAITSIAQEEISPLPNGYAFEEYENVRVNPPRQIGITGVYRFNR